MKRPIGWIIDHEIFLTWNYDTADRASRRPNYVPIYSVDDPLLNEYEVIRTEKSGGSESIHRYELKKLPKIEPGMYNIEPVNEWYGIRLPKPSWGIFQMNHRGKVPITVHDTLLKARIELRERLKRDKELLDVVSRDNGMFHRSRTI